MGFSVSFTAQGVRTPCETRLQTGIKPLKEANLGGVQAMCAPQQTITNAKTACQRRAYIVYNFFYCDSRVVIFFTPVQIRKIAQANLSDTKNCKSPRGDNVNLHTFHKGVHPTMHSEIMKYKCVIKSKACMAKNDLSSFFEDPIRDCFAQILNKHTVKTRN